jgi:hypothetical protein
MDVSSSKGQLRVRNLHRFGRVMALDVCKSMFKCRLYAKNIIVKNIIVIFISIFINTCIFSHQNFF